METGNKREIEKNFETDHVDVLMHLAEYVKDFSKYAAFTIIEP